MDRAGHMLGHWLGNQFDWEEREREIAAFSLTLILSSFYFLGLLLALSSIVGAATEALVMACSAGFLRTFAGGAHLSTGWRCGTISAVLATLVALTAKALAPVLASGFVLGPILGPVLATVGLASLMMWVMSKRAPVDVPEKPITSEKQRMRLKAASVRIPALWALLWTSLLATTTSAAHSPWSDARIDLHALWFASAIGMLWETVSVLPAGMKLVKWIDLQFGRMRLTTRGGQQQ